MRTLASKNRTVQRRAHGERRREVEKTGNMKRRERASKPSTVATVTSTTFAYRLLGFGFSSRTPESVRVCVCVC